MSIVQHLQYLIEYIIQEWPESKTQLQQDIRTYWTFRDDMTVMNGVFIKGRYIAIPEELQLQALKQIHIIHKDIKN